MYRNVRSDIDIYSSGEKFGDHDDCVSAKRSIGNILVLLQNSSGREEKGEEALFGWRKDG